MKWTPGRRSADLEDRRGASSGGGGGGGVGMGGLGGGGRGFGGGKLGLGGIVILLVLSLVFKQDFLGLAGGGGAVPVAEQQEAPVQDPREENAVQFVSFILDNSQDLWTQLLAREGATYRRARLVLFRDETATACGAGQAATGPFYCPADEKVYLDLSFFDELHRRFGAPGDFAQAYVIAHEIGHHVQNVLGTSTQVRRLQQRAGQAEVNALSVRLELQADCYAGVWAAAAARENRLEAGDTEEGLGAAAAVGDDRLQKMSTGRVSPESWTHGSSAQRMEWFTRGFRDGSPAACDTFGR